MARNSLYDYLTRPGQTRPRRRSPGRRRSKVWAAAAALVAIILVVQAVVQRAQGPHSQWQQSFSDDFDNSADLSQWTIYDGAAPHSNRETGWWSASHVSIADGKLNLAGYADMTTTGDRRIVTGGVGLYRHAQVYGKWVSRIRVDACAQVKYVMLLWPVSGEWPKAGEVDFAEDQGGDRAVTTGSVVFANPQPGKVFAATSQRLQLPTPLTQWHTLGVEWTPSAIRYTLDGHYWGKPVTRNVPTTPMAFVVQTEALTSAPTTDTQLRCDAQVDWVKQYRYAG